MYCKSITGPCLVIDVWKLPEAYWIFVQFTQLVVDGYCILFAPLIIYLGSGPVFWQLSRVSAKESRCYVCNVFSHWLRPCSLIDRKWALGPLRHGSITHNISSSAVMTTNGRQIIVKCHYNLPIMIYYMQCLKQKISQCINSQKTTHISSCRASYGLYIMRIY